MLQKSVETAAYYVAFLGIPCGKPGGKAGDVPSEAFIQHAGKQRVHPFLILPNHIDEESDHMKFAAGQKLSCIIQHFETAFARSIPQLRKRDFKKFRVSCFGFAKCAGSFKVLRRRMI